MVSLKFIHAADLHLDSPLRGLARYQGAPLALLHGATRRAFTNLVQVCLDEEVDFLLLAGDLYDGDWQDYNTGLFFTGQLAKLARAGVRVVLVRGNHDAESQITRSLRLPEGVADLSTRKPQTLRFDELNVAIHGHGYGQRAVHDNLASGYPEPRAGYFNIGLLHTALSGREGHAPYAPCSREELVAKGYDYWALGHVHRREVVWEQPWIVFPGNLQGRHIRETGAKGASLVTVVDGAIASVEHRPLDVLRWALCELDVAGAAGAYAVLEHARLAFTQALAATDGRPLALRLRLHGACAAHQELLRDPERWHNELRSVANDLAHDLAAELWLEKIELRTRAPLELTPLADGDDPLAELVRSLRELPDQPDELAPLMAEFAVLKSKLPPEYYQLDDALEWDNPAVLSTLLSEVEQRLLPRLLVER